MSFAPYLLGCIFTLAVLLTLIGYEVWLLCRRLDRAEREVAETQTSLTYLRAEVSRLDNEVERLEVAMFTQDLAADGDQE